MTLADSLTRRLAGETLSFDERARLRCQIACDLEHKGQYETAREVFGDLWLGIGQRPSLAGLTPLTAAEVLLRAGTLTSWLGNVEQIEGAQETAKDLISESASRFQALGETAKAAAALSDLGYCYRRVGAYDDARAFYHAALENLSDADQELKGKILLRLVAVECLTGRYHDALHTLTDATPLFKEGANHALEGRYHNELALVFWRLGSNERREDYTDRALLEYSAATYHFEQAGHTSYLARAENNLALLHYTIGRYADAHEHLNRARRLFLGLKDRGSVAQVDDTRARVLLAEGRTEEAERVIRGAVEALEKSGEQGVLADALTTQGLVLARLGKHVQSQAKLLYATDLAEQAGSLEDAGRALLTLIEEHHQRIPESELKGAYRRADQLLSKTQDAEDISRLRACAHLVIVSQQVSPSHNRPETIFVHAEESTNALLCDAQKFAATNSPLLLSGETGTGKEVLARYIHERSGRAGAFIAFNCATLTETLAESQLFGHRKGSFTDAHSDYSGAVNEAAGGTLLLDEISEVSLAVQSKILRLIECGEIHPVGAAMPEHVDLRFIATSNRDLAEMVKRGEFRIDLFYRIAALELELPPLRERRGDIVALARHFIAEANERNRKQVRFTSESLEMLCELPLRGNARELRSIIERMVVTALDGSTIPAETLQILLLRGNSGGTVADPWANFSLSEEVCAHEAKFIEQALRETQGSVSCAARLLGFKHHESLAYLLRTRHKSLMSARTPVVRRKRSIFKNR